MTRAIWRGCALLWGNDDSRAQCRPLKDCFSVVP
jgi:hypothetical protein